MSGPDAGDEPAPILATDPDVRELMGLFDVPAFARRGQDMEFALNGLHSRCRTARAGHARHGPRPPPAVVAHGGRPRGLVRRVLAPRSTTSGRLEPVRAAAMGRLPAPIRQRRAVARDLVASVERFNDRWRRHVAKLDFEPINAMIDQYNVYYVIEKECVMGSARLAARFVRAARAGVGCIDPRRSPPSPCSRNVRRVKLGR